NLLQRCAIGINFTVDVTFTNTTGDQLIILAAKIENNDGFLLHEALLSYSKEYISSYYITNAEKLVDRNAKNVKIPPRHMKPGRYFRSKIRSNWNCAVIPYA